MKPPRIPPLVTDIVQTALSSLDGMEFTAISSCPFCGGALQAHDSKKKSLPYSVSSVVNGPFISG
jgi:hypothetical protein